MMNWEKTDKLYAIANDPTMSTDARKSAIVEFMRYWSYDANYRGAYACNAMLYTDLDETDIDPSKEATKAKLPLPGQTGRTWYPGQ